jgi:hypothetical protein
MLLNRQSLALSVFICLSGCLFANPVLAATKKVSSGKVKAELTYYSSYGKDSSYYTDISLKITRQGKTLFTTGVAPSFGSPELRVIDLDKDKEPEILVTGKQSASSSGSGSTSIYRYNSKQNKYDELFVAWCSDKFEIKDIDKDGQVEFEAFDCIGAEFTSNSDAVHPILIWQYRQGKLINATRRFPSSVRNSANDAWQSYLRKKKEGWNVKGALTAYLACKYLLGEETEGWKQVKQAYQGSDRLTFFKELRQHLIDKGYARS